MAGGIGANVDDNGMFMWRQDMEAEPAHFDAFDAMSCNPYQLKVGAAKHAEIVHAGIAWAVARNVGFQYGPCEGDLKIPDTVCLTLVPDAEGPVPVIVDEDDLEGRIVGALRHLPFHVLNRRLPVILGIGKVVIAFAAMVWGDGAVGTAAFARHEKAAQRFAQGSRIFVCRSPAESGHVDALSPIALRLGVRGSKKHGRIPVLGVLEVGPEGTGMEVLELGQLLSEALRFPVMGRLIYDGELAGRAREQRYVAEILGHPQSRTAVEVLPGQVQEIDTSPAGRRPIEVGESLMMREVAREPIAGCLAEETADIEIESHCRETAGECVVPSYA